MTGKGNSNPDLRVVADLQDLVDHSEIDRVTFYEVSARRSDGGSVDEDGGAESPEGEEDDVDQAVRVMVNREAEFIEVRCEGKIGTPDATYLVDVGARFVYEGRLQVSDDIANEFVERVGVMAVWPFLREAARDLSAKIDAGRLVIGLMRAGRIELAPNPPEGSRWADESSEATDCPTHD